MSVTCRGVTHVRFAVADFRADLLRPRTSDPDFAEIVELFVVGLTKRLDAMQDALQANDMDCLRRPAHQLKGSGGGHGYPTLSQNASVLEQQILEGATGEITRGLNELASLVARIKMLP